MSIFFKHLDLLSGYRTISTKHWKTWETLSEEVYQALEMDDKKNVYIEPTSVSGAVWELYLDLSRMNSFVRPTKSTTDSRNDAASKVESVVLLITGVFKEHDLIPRFPFLDFYGTGASLRALWPTDLKDDVVAIDLSQSSVSWRTFYNIKNCPQLQTLVLDHCGTDGERFTNLGPCANLETLSLVQTSLRLPRDWLPETEKNCPKLSNIYISMGKNQKILGLGDDVTLCTIINPVILECGHLISEEVLAYMLGKRCPTCRRDITKRTIKISPIIWIRKEQEDEKSRWLSEVVDILRKPLDDKILAHTRCGALYNESSLCRVFPCVWDGWETGLTDLALQTCACCGIIFGGDIQVVYITNKGGTAQEVGFLELGELNKYL